MSDGGLPWWFEVLGALRASRDGQDVALGAPKQRVVFAVLVLGRNTVVGRDQIIDALWGETAPTSAVNVVHTYVAGLRRALEPSRASRSQGDLLRSSGDGYRLRLDPSWVDLDVFDTRTTAAARLRAAGDLAAAAGELDAALALWQGDPLGGLPGLFAEVERSRLVERRLTVLEERADIRLALGRGADVVAELTRLVDEYPLRERLYGMTMRALCQTGRQAEALAAYRTARQVLIDELGVEPGPELQRLHQAVLSGEDLSGSAEQRPQVVVAAAVPGQLPPDPATFVGREDLLDRLDTLRAATPNGLVVAITGPAGVGKTALAAHWAHRVRADFPDGQLHVDLHGYDPQRDPLDANEVLRRFLRALGVAAGEVPSTVDERAALFRTIVSDRRMIIMLDNARGSDELMPLLAGSSCLVLVTSRRRLDGLVAHADAKLLDVDMLSDAEAVDLLGRIAGSARLREEPAQVAKLASLCDRLPLALRIAAARLAVAPRQPVAALVSELDDEQGRLAALGLEGGESAVRSAFDASRRALPPLPARLLALLGLHPGHDITAHLVAAMAEVRHCDAMRALDLLEAAHLLTVIEPGRFMPHDLVRAYCVTLAAEELSEGEQRAVAGRMLDYYLYCADLADGLLPITRGSVEVSPSFVPADIPVIDSAATAMAWLETERVNLLAVSAYAVTHDWPVHAWQLPYTLSRLFWLLADKDSWLATHEAATPVVRWLQDPLAQFVTLHNLGVVLTLHERFEEALDAEREALSVSRRQGHGEWQARAYTSIANILQSTGRPHEAEVQYLRAAEISKRTGAQFAEANNLHNLACLYAGEQRHTDAVQQLRAALEIYRQLGDSVGETAGLSTLAESLIALGEGSEALTTGKRALEVAVEASSVYHQGIAHDRIAQALDFLGDQSALPHWQRSLSVLTDLGAPEADDVRARLARAKVSVRTPA